MPPTRMYVYASQSCTDWSPQGLNFFLCDLLRPTSGVTAVFGATAHCLLELLDLLAPLCSLDRPPLAAGRFDWPSLFRHGARAREAMDG